MVFGKLSSSWMVTGFPLYPPSQPCSTLSLSTWILGWKHRDTYWLLENSVSEERVEECRGRMGAGLQTLPFQV